MESVWTPRRQGDAGELSAINWLVGAGARVYLPMFTDPDCDLVADFGERIDRVQVKTSTCWHNNRFVVTVCTRGGNQSWNGVVKRIEPSRCDRVFVHRVGGPRYAVYEVEPGEPLQARPPPLDTVA